MFNLQATYVVKKKILSKNCPIFLKRIEHKKEQSYGKFSINKKESRELELAFYSLFPQAFSVL